VHEDDGVDNFWVHPSCPSAGWRDTASPGIPTDGRLDHDDFVAHVSITKLRRAGSRPRWRGLGLGPEAGHRRAPRHAGRLDAIAKKATSQDARRASKRLPPDEWVAPNASTSPRPCRGLFRQNCFRERLRERVEAGLIARRRRGEVRYGVLCAAFRAFLSCLLIRGSRVRTPTRSPSKPLI
jgi:hypothetical protein